MSFPLIEITSSSPRGWMKKYPAHKDYKHWDNCGYHPTSRVSITYWSIFMFHWLISMRQKSSPLISNWQMFVSWQNNCCRRLGGNPGKLQSSPRPLTNWNVTLCHSLNEPGFSVLDDDGFGVAPLTFYLCQEHDYLQPPSPRDTVPPGAKGS